MIININKLALKCYYVNRLCFNKNINKYINNYILLIKEFFKLYYINIKNFFINIFLKKII